MKGMVTMEDKKLTRRGFVQTVVGGAVLGGIAAQLRPLEIIAGAAGPTPDMPTRPLGKTGHRVKIFSLGGQATLETSGREEESSAIIDRALDLGVNYIDTAAAYGGGISETYIGKVMRNRRKEVFLASKTHDRSYDGSMRLLERSLRNLQTDHLDLWQLHNVRTQSDLNSIFSSDGSIKAMEKARDQKMVRFLGITGHRDPLILRKGIQQYPFDAILMSLNAADKHNASFIDHLLPTAVEKGMAVIGMKIPARGRIFREGGITTMEQAMRYVLTLPVSTVIIGISTIQDLEEDVRIAKQFTPLTRQEMAALEELTRPYYSDATWFKEKW
jgi:aryl-alcohol dehydrogenase-like predicted oxidoreductase